MKYLPTLLPGHFSGLLGWRQGSDKTPAPQSTQAGPTQAGPTQAGPTQAGPTQAGPTQAGPTQAGPTQAGPTQAPTRLNEVDDDDDDEEDDDNDDDGLYHSLLAKLEGIITTDVWKLGFNHVMYKELKFVRCEAQLRSFQECQLLQGIPWEQRCALLVYEALKSQCYRTGSTYMELQALCEEAMRTSPFLGEVQVWEAVHFMKELGVVVCKSRRVALQNLHFYETGIAGCLRRLVEAEPWVIPLDAAQVLGDDARRRLSLRAGAEQGGVGGAEADPSAGRPAAPGTSHARPDLRRPPSDPARQHPSPPVDPDQVRAMEMICSNPVTVISGKGGCGKTTVVSLVFKAALRKQPRTDGDVGVARGGFQNDPTAPEARGKNGPIEGEVKEEGVALQRTEVLLTAPTGRAASLLSKNTFQAYTLHQVLWSFMLAKKNGDGAPQGWKFARVRVLVVDEGSLVPVMLLHSVLTMLTEHAQLRKFIILGDVRQLPSIQPGNTLHDLFHSLAPARWAIEMKTNHRAESQLIVDNAGLISEMGMKICSFRELNYDAVVDSNGNSTIPSEDKRFIHILLPKTKDSNYNLQMAIEVLLESDPGLKDDKTSQFIAFRRKDCALINELCCKHYSRHCTKNSKNKPDFQCGDKVCCTKNGYVTDLNKEGFSKDEDFESSCVPDQAGLHSRGENEATQKNKERLCNGEIFFIIDDVTQQEDGPKGRRQNRSLTLEDGDGRTLRVSFRELQRECRLQHAWARTIHTFQGSETETVVYVLGNGSAQTWKHVYTAVTRGQKRVYIVAEREGMEVAVKRHVITRNTRLGAMVRELLSQPDGARHKRMHSVDGSKLDASPSKCQKMGPVDSPLGSSILQQLSLCAHNNTPCGRRLFQSPP